MLEGRTTAAIQQYNGNFLKTFYHPLYDRVTVTANGLKHFLSHRWLHVGRGDAAALSTADRSGNDLHWVQAQEVCEEVGPEHRAGLLPVQAVNRSEAYGYVCGF